MPTYEFSLALHTVSEINCSEHWAKRLSRHKGQQAFIRLAYKAYVKDITYPCEVKMTRYGPKLLDDDNLPTAFKYIRDELAECILPEYRKSYVTKKGKIKSLKGWGDSDPRITWHYAQESRPIHGIMVLITC